MGSTTPQCRDALALARAAVLPSGWSDTVGATDGPISELINFRDTQPAPAPVQRFGCAVTAAPTWLGVRMVRYSFSCVPLSSTTSRRFIPTHPDREVRPTTSGLLVTVAGL